MQRRFRIRVVALGKAREARAQWRRLNSAVCRRGHTLANVTIAELFWLSRVFAGAPLRLDCRSQGRIGVEGDADGRVAEPLAHDLRMHTGSQLLRPDVC